MDAQTVIKNIGGAYFVADEICRRYGEKITPQAIYQWTAIPYERCWQIAEISGGRYSVRELRPDFFGPVAA